MCSAQRSSQPRDRGSTGYTMQIIALLLTLVSPGLMFAQAPPFEWVRRGGGSFEDYGRALALDQSGSVYVTGSFIGSATFGTNSVTTGVGDTSSMYLAKYDSSGQVLWIFVPVMSVQSYGPTSAGFGLAVDARTNIYVTGGFSQIVRFGAYTLRRTNTFRSDIFVAKFDSRGNVLWAVQGGGWDSENRGNAVAVGPDGNIHVVGKFQGVANFGSLTVSSAGSDEAFHTTYDPNGNVLAVAKAGGSGSDEALAVALDSQGNVFIGGDFQDTATFGGIVLQSQNANAYQQAFVAKYDGGGTARWAISIGTALHDYVNGIATDVASNVFVVGSLSNEANGFLSKYDSSGNLFWTRNAGAVNSVSSDSAGNAYLTGGLRGTVNFGPTNLTSAGGGDIFLAKYDGMGTAQWAKRAGLIYDDFGRGIVVDPFGNVFVTGSFYDTATFDSTNVPSAGRDDMFLVKLPATAPVPPAISSQPQDKAVFQGSNAAFSVVAAGTEPLAYQWQFNGGNLASATNSSVTITNVQATTEGSYRVIVSNAGGATTSLVAMLTIVYQPSITNQPQSQIVIAGTNVSFSVLAGGTAPLTYQWRFNGTNIANATNTTLVVSNVQPANGGNYTVVVTNNYGAITSSIASLTVRYSLSISVIGMGVVSRNPVSTLLPPNSTVTLTANAAAGYGFGVWSGDASGNTNPLSVTMTTNKAITANFFSTAVTFAIQGQGSVSKAPDKAYYAVDEQVTLTGVPGRWFEFTRWGDGPTVNPRVITIGQSNNYSALFSPTTALETVTFNNVSRTAPVGMPIVFVDSEFIVTNRVFRLGGAEITMQTTFPNGTILFTTDGTEPSIFSSLYEGPITISKSKTIRAVAYDADFASSWEADPIQISIRPTYFLSALTAGGGTISVSPTSQNIPSNTVVTVTAVPKAGWSLLQWLGDAQGSNSTMTFTMNQNYCIEAVFGTPLTTSTSGSGSIVIAPRAAMYPYGWTVGMAAIPQPGNVFALWGDSGRGTNNPLSFVVTNANANVSAVFGASPAGQYSLTMRTVGHGRVTMSPRANRYASGQAVSASATPDADQEFVGWSGDASGTNNPLSITMNQDKLITATFTRKPRLAIWNCGDREANDPLRIILSGELGDRFGIETSSDMVSWLPDRELTNDFGRVQCDLPLSNSGSQFIRLRLK